MKKFILRISPIIAIVVILIGIGESVVRKSNNQYKYKNDYIIENGWKVKTIILGSSHSYYGIMPNILSDSSFSLANVSQPIKYDYFMLENYEAHLPNLENIILDISYFSIRSSGFAKAKSRPYKINYKVYMNFTQLQNFSFSNLVFSNFGMFNTKLRDKLNDNNDISCDKFGWGEDYNADKKGHSWDDATEAVKRHTKSDNRKKYLSKNIVYLNNIAEFCERNNITLTIITTPTWHTYYNNIDQPQLNEVYSNIEAIQRKYKVAYYNFLQDSRFTADDFYDTDHLSNIGAEKFSKILADTLRL